MRAIARFEARLLEVLYGVLQRAPLEQTARVLGQPLPRPKCLSRDAVELIENTLAKGCVRFLARRGWMRERFLRDGKVAEGRLWHRTPPDEFGLTFSKHSLELLIQLVSGSLGKPVPKSNELTVGDRFLLFLVFEAVRNLEAGEEMRKKWIPLHQDGLCRLAFMEELAEGKERYRIDWIPWTTGQGASILESLQLWLADRWTQLERKKETIDKIAHMRVIGATQQRVYGEYLDTLTNLQRWDLARCFLESGGRLLQDRPTARRWIQHLDVRNERIADRLVIYQEALAFLRQFDRFQQWQNTAVGVGYFDEGYHACQLWKADWEQYQGDQLCACAHVIVREVEPMK